MRKYQALDLMDIYTKSDTATWNKILAAHVKSRNINGLAKLRYQLQAGMEDVSKAKLNSEAVVLFYIRLLRSIEKTAKMILTLKHPLPGDNALLAPEYPEWLSVKRKRDKELADFMRLSSY